MADKKVYPKGIAIFKKNEKAPEWVGETILITPKILNEWLNGDGKQYLTDYKGNDQIKLQITTYEGKPSISVDTYKKTDAPYW